MLDLAQLLPHSKRDAKLDTKTDRGVINEVADMKVTGCLLAQLYAMLVLLDWLHQLGIAGLQQRTVL